jgi:two-component system sensor kinase FixL
MIAILLRAGRVKILIASAILVVLTTLVDWLVGNNVSLAASYVLPVMLAATVLRPAETAILALVCSYLRSLFDLPGSPTEIALRFTFAASAYFLLGCFVTVLVRNRELVIEHLASTEKEQALRREAEEQLRLLAESSPAAIFTTDGKGLVLAGNSAADQLFGVPEGQLLRGRQIGGYLPILRDALSLNVAREGIRTSAKCQGYRENGDIFQAQIWFSSYTSEDGPRLAAIAVDSTEEMRDREQQGMRQLMRGNRIAAAAVAHEVRNFCGAMASRCENLGDHYGLSADQDFSGLTHLISGLEAIASLELLARSQEQIHQVDLREVLNDLRIVIEADWREIDGIVHWHLPDEMPAVIAEAHGLLQAFLNVSQNSHRAVQEVDNREFHIRVVPGGARVRVRFEDTGPGVRDPEGLFQPFQRGATGTGMGLYVSRVLVRSYGGDLTYEPLCSGSCFQIELETV